jgi:hemolysin III
MEPVKPKLRGVLHQWGAIAALGAGFVLVALAPNHRAATAAGVYVGSLVALFTVSAAYHRVTWKPRARAWMRRLDHSSIFILIAGSYTPVALVGLPAEASDRLMLVIWSGAAIGVLQSLLWIGAPKFVPALLAVALGWTIVPYLSEVRQALEPHQLGLTLTAGVVYSFGAVAYALKRPQLWPAMFGYHELFHALTLVGAALHFASVLSIMRGA